MAATAPARGSDRPESTASPEGDDMQITLGGQSQRPIAQLEQVLVFDVRRWDASGMDLEALEEIRRLKYRYFRSLDLKLWDEFADTFTADAVGRYGTKVYGELDALEGRDAIVGFMSEKLSNGVITMHVAHHPEIDVDGDTAEASWGFEDTVIAPGVQGPDPRRRLLPRPLPPRGRRSGGSPRRRTSGSTSRWSRSTTPRATSSSPTAGRLPAPSRACEPREGAPATEGAHDERLARAYDLTTLRQRDQPQAFSSSARDVSRCVSSRCR